MTEVLPFFISGIVFGLAAGMSPGPLLTVVVAETIRHGRKEGMKVAITPLITDLPIILLTIFVLSKLSNFNHILGAIAIFGAVFLFYLAYESIQSNTMKLEMKKVKPQSIKKGILINALSPHPYIFWLTIGSPTLFKANDKGFMAVLFFVVAFYSLLVGSKIVVAIITEKSRDFLQNKVYSWIMKILGVFLFVFGLIFIYNGLQYFGMI